MIRRDLDTIVVRFKSCFTETEIIYESTKHVQQRCHTTSYTSLLKLKCNGLKEWNKIYRIHDMFLARFWKQIANCLECSASGLHVEIRDFQNLQRSLTDGRETSRKLPKIHRRSARVCLSFFRSTNRRTKVIPQTSKLISMWKRERRTVFVEGRPGWSSRYKLVCISTFVNTKSILSATSPFSTDQIQIFHLRTIRRRFEAIGAR